MPFTEELGTRQDSNCVLKPSPSGISLSTIRCPDQVPLERWRPFTEHISADSAVRDSGAADATISCPGQIGIQRARSADAMEEFEPPTYALVVLRILSAIETNFLFFSIQVNLSTVSAPP
jgi:hypothetical protein